MRACALALVTIVVAAGCGGGEAREQREAAGKREVPLTALPGRKQPPVRNCQAVGSHGGRTYRLCWRPLRRNDHGTFEVLENGVRSRIANALPPAPPPGTPLIGHWRWAALSPDGRTLLAQWSAECEIPVAYFVPTSGGRARPVGELDRVGTPPVSEALGWTTDGRAIVAFPELACGGSESRPGTYLVSLDGRRQYWRPLGSVQPSKESRAIAQT